MEEDNDHDVELFLGGRSKTCKPDQEMQLTATLEAVTKSTDPKYLLPAIKNDPRSVNINSQGPPMSNTQPTPPSGLSSGAESARPCGLLVLVLLVEAAVRVALSSSQSPRGVSSWPAALGPQVGPRR